jgi:hypothetical protein
VGLQEMRITNWGQYNFEYPLAWLKSIDTAGLYHFEVLGNITASWHLKSISGFTIVDSLTGIFPAEFTALPITSSARSIAFEYNGPDYKNQFGVVEKTGSLFGYNAPLLHSTPRD